ncbi:hypothetical protein IPA_03490 [Ignicoccus pacificus DSM 13166]|uniref:Uncharacterized protein n=1 Tax=Ignicoccus pacificus DSM 13166 TaxID=940294 RepID=A0A977K9D2_9CREN|nr:hypothetical protein IPA_03490 [Ignicoccus pacificus DSM 13166]
MGCSMTLGIDELLESVRKTRDIIRKRDVSLSSITMASLLGSLHELGILTQGTVGLLAHYFTPRICAYMLEKGIVNESKSIKENLENAFKAYNYKDGEYSIEAKEDEVKIEIVSERCKLCPKGVGGAEIKGSACPVPYFIGVCLSILTRRRWEPELYETPQGHSAVLKEEGRCKMIIKPR